jgi:phosphoribosylformylglycinamidine synthase
LRLENGTRWSNLEAGSRLRLPVAHGEGRYHLEDGELARLRDKKQIWLTYEDGSNPNGSLADIAGVCNEGRNVCGLMPHPERAVFSWMGGEDGRAILSALLRTA